MMTGKFEDSEVERYARQIIMPEIGGAGQQKLKGAHVGIIGAGGLGSPVAQYLAAAGVGTISLIDDDLVSLSNLHRQLLHGTGDVGRAKVESAAERLTALNPHVHVNAQAVRLDATNIDALLGPVTLVVDGSDNSATRYLTADWCAERKIPLITGSLYRFEGNVTVIAPWLGADRKPGNSASYRDVFPRAGDDTILPDCATAGVLGPAAGVIGTLQAVEAIKMMTGAGSPLIGRLLLYDALSGAFHTMKTTKRP
ncbi:MAG: molybdopterin-synthase adenylyltransferase MoeB [Pseudomonadota bacterium]